MKRLKRKQRRILKRAVIALLILLLCLLAVLLLVRKKPAQESEREPAAQRTEAPLQLELGAQEPEATPVPTPTPAPTPEPTPTPVPYDPLNPPEGVYTIGWISDTQHYAKKFPELYTTELTWVRDNAERLHMGYIVHTGDLVHNVDEDEQWQRADAAMNLIKDIPNGVLAGNHDVDIKSEEEDGLYRQFSKYFGKKRYQNEPWYGESFENNRGHYDLITLGSTDYLFVYLGYVITDEGIAFANRAFQKYPERVGVLCVHGYFDSDLTLLDEGEKVRSKIVDKNQNLYLVLCGHRYNCTVVPYQTADGRTVLQMINNYQAAGFQGGDCYLKLLEVDEAAGVIRHYAYSPLLNDYTYYDTEEHQAENHSFLPDGECGEVKIPWM